MIVDFFSMTRLATISIRSLLKPNKMTKSLSTFAEGASDVILSQKGKSDVWNIFTPLANQHAAVNLGQGFPNFPVASFIKVSPIC